MTTAKKERADKLVVAKGLSESREKARALIMAGQVIAGNRRVDKAGELVPVDAEMRIRGEVSPYVSRGGIKLEYALDYFHIDVTGRIAVDVGASTGGFTDCLLQRGVKKVYAIDVGYGQMAIKVKDDSRVVSIEKTNIRGIENGLIPEKADIAVIDVSFISLTKVIPHVIPLLTDKAETVALIKPQFEVGRGEVGKGGIIRNESQLQQVVENMIRYLEGLGLEVTGVTQSPILGAKGNREFLVYFRSASPLKSAKPSRQEA